MVGAGKFGSAKLPMATVTCPGKPSFSQKTGTVTAYSVGRGFGFIAPDSSFLDDVYVHESNLKASGIDKLETGDRVSFELLPKHPAKPRRLAVNLQILESSQG
jgi:cold shock CspA family protein